MLDQLVNFIRVKIEWFERHSFLEFPIYMFDPMLKKRFLAIIPNTDIEAEIIEKLKTYQSKGAILQVPRQYMNELVLVLENFEKDFDLLNEKNLNLEQLYFERHFEKSQNEYQISTILKSSFEKKDFSALIDIVLSEIKIFDPFCNSEVSTLWVDCENLLGRDSILNRLACLNFLVAQKLGYKQEALSAVFFASYFRFMGISQIQLSDISEREGEFKKLSFLSIYVLSKQNFEFSHLTKRLILEQFELLNGNGFPRGKKDNYIHPLSQVIGVGNHLYESLEKNDLASFKQKLSKLTPEIYRSEITSYLKAWVD